MVLGYIVAVASRHRGYKVVEPETYAGLVIPPGAIRGVTAARKTSGEWKLRFDIDVSFPLPDGRVVKFDRPVSVSGQQRGRKPERKSKPVKRAKQAK